MNIHHIGIEVREIEKSIQFYKSFLGLEPSQFITFQGEQLVFLEGNGFTLELISSNECTNPASIHFAIQIDPLTEWIEQLRSKGFEPLEGPYELKNGWKTVFYNGPDNEIIEFIQQKYLK
ncbi:VOC family protein [Bacillus sp. FJAT-49736]|uniref:VOC family protein n=1 Tax=Bacillus sp. FJAT-49736 TaxID=2833582 RepID=UPI001BC8FE3F|nr:VOC family protein [Bacillus sp. FJAT-49736]MBS4173664.1 VOC family protein [Bacillus sp. FJAT-49736]